ncbi:MAG TPA: triose-phosphate isomerase [Candidatus Nanoarchaeia archaeon]|nr:triose-phosphate isomerase [Candidatus Nanoarchaeia archaeon]
MRKVIIAGNWKMNKGIDESVALAKELKKNLAGSDKEIVICPPFTSLCCVKDALKGSKIKLGAQNMYCENDGAFTGEISPMMLKDAGVKYVILGHSERRHILGEDDALINKKIKCALANQLVPIFCVGETLAEREEGRMKEVITRQVKEGLKGIKEIEGIVIAYEPVWAIGTGKTATPEQAEEVHVLIKGIIKQVYGNIEVPILYGGSVKASNIKELACQKNIDGVLVGGASLDAKTFVEIAAC